MGEISVVTSPHAPEEPLQWHLRVAVLSQNARDTWVTDATCVKVVIFPLTEFVCVWSVMVEGRRVDNSAEKFT